MVAGERRRKTSVLHFRNMCLGWGFFFFSAQPGTTGEQKTKPTQNSVRELRGLGLSPDLVSGAEPDQGVPFFGSFPEPSATSDLLLADHVPLHHRAGELRQRKDLHVLPRGARAGHLRARRVVHLQGAAAAGEPGRGELPEPEAEHAHRDPAQEDADQVEGDVGQVGSGSAPLPPPCFPARV